MKSIFNIRRGYRGRVMAQFVESNESVPLTQTTMSGITTASLNGLTSGSVGWYGNYSSYSGQWNAPSTLAPIENQDVPSILYADELFKKAVEDEVEKRLAEREARRDAELERQTISLKQERAIAFDK